VRVFICLSNMYSYNNIITIVCLYLHTYQAELRPIKEGEENDYTQTDEEDMGMSYSELGVFGTLRKVRCFYSIVVVFCFYYLFESVSSVVDMLMIIHVDDTITYIILDTAIHTYIRFNDVDR